MMLYTIVIVVITVFLSVFSVRLYDNNTVQKFLKWLVSWKRSLGKNDLKYYSNVKYIIEGYRNDEDYKNLEVPAEVNLTRSVPFQIIPLNENEEEMRKNELNLRLYNEYMKNNPSDFEKFRKRWIAFWVDEEKRTIYIKHTKSSMMLGKTGLCGVSYKPFISDNAVFTVVGEKIGCYRKGLVLIQFAKQSTMDDLKNSKKSGKDPVVTVKSEGGPNITEWFFIRFSLKMGKLLRYKDDKEKLLKDNITLLNTVGILDTGSEINVIDKDLANVMLDLKLENDLIVIDDELSGTVVIGDEFCQEEEESYAEFTVRDLPARTFILGLPFLREKNFVYLSSLDCWFIMNKKESFQLVVENEVVKKFEVWAH